jgi:hypothetical protein
LKYSSGLIRRGKKAVNIALTFSNHLGDYLKLGSEESGFCDDYALLDFPLRIPGDRRLRGSAVLAIALPRININLHSQLRVNLIKVFKFMILT